MKIDFSINPKDHSAHLKYSPKDVSNEMDYKNLLSLITIVGADFYLDPELELEQIKDLTEKALQEQKTIDIMFDEEGIELEFIKE